MIRYALFVLSVILLLVAAVIAQRRPWRWERNIQGQVRDDLREIAEGLRADSVVGTWPPPNGCVMAASLRWASRFSVNTGAGTRCFLNLQWYSEPKSALAEDVPTSYAEFVHRWKLPGDYAEGALREAVEIGIDYSGRARPIYKGVLLSFLMTPYICMTPTGGSRTANEVVEELNRGDGLWSCKVGDGTYIYSVGSRTISRDQRSTIFVVFSLAVLGVVGMIAWYILPHRQGPAVESAAKVKRGVAGIRVVCTFVGIWVVILLILSYGGGVTSLPYDKYSRDAFNDYREEIGKLYDRGIISKAQYDEELLASQFGFDKK